MDGASATYSPEDNKLRLYLPARLSEADYDAAKGAGYRWAPKQDCFFATWTPEAEDFALALCGEIGDEDKSLEERAEERAERFEGYEENRREDARAAKEAVDSLSRAIPMGQPILIGHHSERRARRDAEKIQNGMTKAVRAWETADYWKRRAARAIAHAKHKERPDVRARRIKTLEAEERKMQKRVDREGAFGLKFWRGETKWKRRGDDGAEFEPLAMTEENRERIAKMLGETAAGSLAEFYIRREDGGRSSAWDCLRPKKERYKDTPDLTVEEIAKRGVECFARQVENATRWRDHYRRRLEYERAMLEADGGTVADKTGPEVGGACQCWCSRSAGGWSLIQKVNKVSVTILDNWGNGGDDFTRTIPFDKLTRIMTKAQVEEARAAGRVLAESKLGFFLREAEPKPETPTTPDPEREAFQNLAKTAEAGVEVISSPDLFPTPPEIAARMVEAAEIEPSHRVLEPSAGTGNIVRAIREQVPAATVEAVELNARLAERIDGCRTADFLTCNGDLGMFDRIVMNPPFSGGADIRHIRHAAGMLNPGGVLVALCAAGPRQRAFFENELRAEWEELPAGSFAPVGTNVRVAMVTVRN